MSLHRYLVRMIAFSGFILALGVLLHERLIVAFLSNPALNTVIIGCMLTGAALSYIRFIRIRQEDQWLRDIGNTSTLPLSYEPTFLASLVMVFSDFSPGVSISPVTARSLTSSVEARLEESRDISRYLMGLLIFLGLLGTFWGLSQTISTIAAVVGGLDVNAGSAQQSFQDLKQGLQSPLSGMGIAFSSSLFGLAGSLIIGFLDLQVSRAASAFLNDVENRLNGMIRLGSAETVSGAAAHSGPAYLQGLLEQVTENMSQLQQLLRKHEDNRSNVVQSMNLVGEKMSLLSEHMVAQQVVLKKVAHAHAEQQNQMNQLTQLLTHPKGDETMRQYLRNLDSTLTRMLEEVIEGRNKSTQELRNELRLVARTISALGDEGAAA